MVLCSRYWRPSDSKTRTTTTKRVSKVAYYCFQMKNIDILKLNHFKELKTSTELLVSANDVKYHFSF